MSHAKSGAWEFDKDDFGPEPFVETPRTGEELPEKFCGLITKEYLKHWRLCVQSTICERGSASGAPLKFR